MSRSVPMSAYLALRRRPAQAEAAARPARPRGSLVWVHCATPDRLAAVADLASALSADGDPVHVIATVPSSQLAAVPPDLPVLVQPAPPDGRAAVRDFLAYWKPDVLLWLGGALRPVLLSETDDSRMARLLADITSDAVLLQGGRWMPGIARTVLSTFDRILAADAGALDRLRKYGVPDDRLTLSGRLEPGAPVLPFVESDRRDLAKALGTRPVWLSAETPIEEVGHVLRARQQASRRAHRLLLILTTPDPGAALQVLDAEGLSVRNRLDGTDPQEGTQVLLTDGSEPGLWYRLAPVTYMGGTLSGHDGRDPFEPATLGSALIHGPSTGLYADRYNRLMEAGASRRIRTPADLGPALETLLAPDRAATMAHAAWDVTSGGAETANRVVEMIRTALDRVWT